MNHLFDISRQRATAYALHAACALATAALCLAGGVGGSGLRARIGRVHESRQQSLALLQRGPAMKLRSERLADEIRSAEHSAKQLRVRLPDSPDETEFLQQLSAMTEHAGLELSDFRPGNLADRKGFKELELFIRVAGPYSELCQFLAKIEHLPRMIRISQMTVNAPNQAGGDCTVDLQLQLVFALQSEIAMATAR